MRLSLFRAGGLVAVVALAACHHATEPSSGPLAKIIAISPTSITGTAGLAVTDSVVVKAVDASGRGVAGLELSFTVTRGAGTVSPKNAATRSDGTLATKWTLGTVAGANEIVVDQASSDNSIAVTFDAVGKAGPPVAVSVTPHTLRLQSSTDTAHVTGTPVDQFGNAVAGAVTYTSRDPTVATVDGSGVVQAVKHHATTYIVASGNGSLDSTYFVALGSGDSQCFGFAAGITPAVGAVVTTGFGTDGNLCIHASTAAEYAVVPFYASTVPSASTTVTMVANGITTVSALGDVLTGTSAARLARPSTPPPMVNEFFHKQMMMQERHELPGRTAGAREWMRQRQSTLSATRNAAAGASFATIGIPVSTVPAVGDVWTLNADATNYCDTSSGRGNFRQARIAAVSNRAIVAADVSNPAGFSDAEYLAYAQTFDTAMFAVDSSNFGAPTDIDKNGRVVLFFTNAVNALSSLDGVVLGFYYSRDLLPKSGPQGACPGSNVGEMVYLMVPSTTPAEATKSFVQTNTPATVAHEFQHLINASRRLYVNAGAAPLEEVWLNEGLSHIAEELLFYRQSGTAPLQNIGNAIGTTLSTPFMADQRNNFSRFDAYLGFPESQGPIGSDDEDDDIPTRGAIWAFLRYAADQTAPTNEPLFWFSLVNSQTTGVANLAAATGADVYSLMNQWAISVFMDDLVTTAPQYQQPSWNFRAAWPAGAGHAYSPHTVALTDGSTRTIALNAEGVAFARFGVTAGTDAYVQVTQNGQLLPAGMRLALVRTK